MADTETATVPDVTQEPAESKVEEPNNNADAPTPAAENPEGVQDESPADDPPAAGQDSKDSQEPGPEPEAGLPQTGDAEEEAARGEHEAKEGGVSLDAQAPQETLQEEQPQAEDKTEQAGDDAVGPQEGDDGEAKESTEKAPEGEAETEETPGGNPVLENPSKENVEGDGAEQGSSTAVADATPQGDEKPAPEEPAPADASAEASADVSADAAADISAEAAADVPAEASTEASAEAQESGEATVQEVPVETEVRDAVDEVDTQEQSAEISNDNEKVEEANVVHDDEAKEENEPPTITEPATSQNQEGVSEDQTAAVDEPPSDVEKDAAPTLDDTQVSAVPDTEPSEETQELTDYEIKYQAAQKDIEELRALNVEIQQRLDTSEQDAKERKRQQGSSEGKDNMKVQTDYLARELSQQQNTEKYLREKLAEVLEEKEESERKCKDLQLRLKRFVKDDQAKDERMAKMEGELREISQEVQVLEQHLDEATLAKIKRSRTGQATNGDASVTRTQVKTTESPVPQSKTCVIL